MFRNLPSRLVRSDLSVSGTGLIADGPVSEGDRSRTVEGVLEPVRSWASMLSLCLVLWARASGTLDSA